MPDAVGANVTLKVQVFPGPGAAATLAPQVLVCAKSPAATTFEMVKAPLPELVRVTVWAALVVPTACPVNVSVLGERFTTGASWPTPINCAVCGLPGALSVTTIEPVRVPAAVGEKVTVIVQ